MFNLEKLESILGYTFRDKDLARQAMTHSSVGKKNYERLEYTGDGFLSHFVGQTLTKSDARADPGVLTRRRSAITNNEFLAAVARRLGLNEQLITNERSPSSKVLADIVEGAIGAVLEDAGEAEAGKLVHRLLGSSLPMGVHHRPDRDDARQPRQPRKQPQAAFAALSPHESTRQGTLAWSNLKYRSVVSKTRNGR